MFTNSFSCQYLKCFINYAIKTDNSEIKKLGTYFKTIRRLLFRVFSDFFKTFSSKTFYFTDLENGLDT